MSALLFFDTETTGLPIWKEPSEDPSQPHIVQLAASLIDSETRKTIAAIDLIVKPDGWVIPEETIAVHGITNEYANKYGIYEKPVIDLFYDLHSRADVRIAHNETFDARIARIAMKRYGYADADCDQFKAVTSECTMWLSLPICKLPKAKGGGFKQPKLSEAYEYFLNKPLENAHSARADVDACIAVYFAIKDKA